MYNVIGKFFLETDLDLPDNFADKDFLPEYKQPTLRHPTAEDYGRGVGKILLDRQGEAMVPKEIIYKLQMRADLETVEAVIQKAHQELATQFSCIILKDLWTIVLDYLTPEDNVQMVTTVVGEAKLSFFAQQVPKEDIALLKSVLTPLIGIHKEWKGLRDGTRSLGIEMGTNRASKRPALATGGARIDVGFLIILDDNNKLVVKDKSNKYAVLDPLKAFEQIREFASRVKLYVEASKKLQIKKMMIGS